MNSAIKTRPVFIAALPREIASLVGQRGWRADAKHLNRKIHLFEHADAIVAYAGMGTHRAALAIEAALELGPASQLISVGWAGACNSHLHTGDIVHVNTVIDSKTGERFFTAERSSEEASQILVTVAAPADVKEKQRLNLSYGASAVDMEAASVARIARARELPFYVIKSISDDISFKLPDISRFNTQDGQFREAAFGLHVALRPRLWTTVLAMAKGSKLSADRLCSAIRAHMEQQRVSIR